MSGLLSLTLLIVLALLSTAEAANPGPGAGYGHLPLSFVANHGQTDPGVAFIAEGKGYTLFLSPSEVTFVAQPPALAGGPSASRLRDPVGRQGGGDPRLDNAPRSVVRLQLLGAEPAPPMSGEAQTSSVNYLIGADRTRWRTGVPAYARVRSRGVYPGIDLVFYGNPRQFEYDFVLAPGADPRSIRLGFAGISESEGRPALHVDAQGDLVLGTTGGDLRLRKPMAYQELGPVRREVAARYVLRSTTASAARTRAEVGIEVAPYDASRPLVIDPVLDYSTYLGGSGIDAGMAIAVDATGHAYVAGFTESPNFPHTTGAVPPAGTRKAFVAKLNASGSGLVYATYLGGNGHDTATAIAIDATGNAYVAGLTESTDFPTLNANQANQGGADAFVTKLDPSGSSLLYSTYLGGGAADAALGVAVSGGMVYVTGYTESADFPRRSAFQRPAGGADAFVAKFDPALSGSASLIYSTLLGGSERDEGHAIAVDAAGNAHIAGFTESPNYPTKNPYQRDVTGPNAFATKLTAVGSTLHYSTYLAGAGIDVGLGIAIDAAGMMYVTGHTASADFPIRNPYQASLKGATDAFITKLNPAASGNSSLVSSTYLGGSGADAGVAIAIGTDQRVSVAGYTDSTNFPTLNPALPDRGGRDAFVVKLDLGSGSPLIYSTYVGGGGDDEAYGIALDPEGNAYITGLTRSADFPAVTAFATALGGSQDAFVAKLHEPPSGADLTVSAISASVSGTTITVTATTKNEGNLDAGSTATNFYLSSDTAFDASDVLLGSRSVPALAAGAISAGSTGLTLPSSVASGPYFILARADADSAISELDEDNNTASTPLTVGPDLSVSTVTPAAAQAAEGTPVSITDTTVNQGARAAVASVTKFFLSTDATLDASDVVLGSRTVSALAAGGSSPGSTTVTIPAGTAGTFFIIAQADAGGENAEGNESNNTAVAASAIGIGPDLVVSTLLAPSTAGAGAAIVVGNTIRNQGAGMAVQSSAKFYLSSDAALDAGDVLLGSRAVPRLNGGSFSTESTTLTVPAGTAIGRYFVIAQVDPDGIVAESNEQNNTAASTAVGLGADLVISSVSAPASAVPGSAITVQETTLNQTSASVGASTTRFYLSRNMILDETDVELGSRAVPALGPGAQSAAATVLVLPTGVGGQYNIIARANADGAIAESDTANNTAASGLVKIGADLVVAIGSAPASTGPGATIAVTATTQNRGAIAAPASSTAFYLSTDAILSGSDVALGSRTVPSLAAAGSDTGSTSLTIPATTAPGTYFIIAQADGDRAIVEMDETNNLATRAIAIGADLTVTQLSVPAHGGAGLPITVTDTTHNASAGAAPASATRFYLSANPALDASDVLVGQRSVPALAGGASHTATTVLTLPATAAPGRFYIIAEANGAGATAEANQANNSRAADLKIGPDLAVHAVTVPPTLAPGSTAAVTYTIINFGGGAAGPFVVRFYVSTDAVLDAGDVLVGSRTVAGIAAGPPWAMDSAPTDLTLPAGLTGGSYHIIAVLDADGAVAEQDETNNVHVRPIFAGADMVVWLDLPAASISGAPGAPLLVTDVTRNQSSIAVGASTTRFYLSQDTILDPSDPLLGSRAVPALAAGEASTASNSLLLPAGVAGAHYIIAVANADGSVQEVDGDNNVAVTGRPVRIGADLVVFLDAPGAASPGDEGSPLLVTDTTRNASALPSAASTTTFYLSEDGALDAGDVLLGSRSVPALDAGEANTVSTAFVIPAWLTGTYRVIGRSDADHAVMDLILRGSEVQVEIVGAAPPAGPASIIAVTDTTRNDSAGPVSESTTSFYLSLDGIAGAGDVPLGSRTVPALAPGEANTASTAFAIPSGELGRYRVVAQSDLGHAVSSILVEGASLVVASDGSGPSAAPGSTITVTDWTKNEASVPSGASTTAFYLSADPILDAGDTFLGSRPVPALAAGQTDTVSTSLTLPATAFGRLYIIAQANTEGAVPEWDETNNTEAKPVTIGADLIVRSVSGPSKAGAGMTIEITDVTANLSAAAAGGSTTRFYLSTNGTLDASDVLLGSRAVPPLLGRAHQAITTVTIPASTATGKYVIIAKADATSSVTEADETNNTTVSASIKIGPDLAVDALGAPVGGGPGSTITVTDTIINYAPATAGASTVKFYVSADASFDAGDVLVGSRSVPSLPGFQTNSGSTTVTLPASLARGLLYIIARADADDAVAEIHEDNNTKARPIQIGPDLVTWLDLAGASSTALPGSTIIITDVAKNDSTSPAGPSTTRFYLSTDKVFGPSAIPIGSRTVPALAPGASSTGVNTLRLPDWLGGPYYHVIARVDADNAVEETSEDNNEASTGIAISTGPDLIVWIDVPGSVANSTAGATVTVTDFTRSESASPAGPSTTKFYLVTGTTLDASAVLLGSRDIPALGASTTNTGSTTLTLPASASGTFRIIAKADADNTVVEANEANNLSVASGAFTLGPDLIAWLDVPGASSTPATGATISVTDFVRNDSATPAPASTSRLLFSTTPTLDASAIVVGTRAIPALGPGEVSSGTITFTLPAGHTGVRYLVARADATNAVTESNEFNNTSARQSITIGTDLIVWIDVPGSVANSVAGATVTVTDFTRSDNSAPAGPSTTKFYLVTGTTLDASAVLLGSRAIPALGASTTNTGSTTLTLPASAIGTFRIIAKADADNTVVEANEANNLSVASGAFTLGPDLIAWLDVPGASSTPPAGATISVTDFVRNDSATPAPASTSRLLFSTTPTLDASAIVVGTRAIPALGPGEVSSGTITFASPAGHTGVRYLVARADSTNAVTESNEFNNSSARQSITIGADLIVTIDVPGSVANSTAGATVTVTDFTRSDNSAPAGPSTTKFYLVTGTTLDASAVLLGSRAIPALGPSTTNTGSTVLTLPASASGTFRIIAKADADNTVVEANEANNLSVASGAFTLGPDLIAWLDVPGAFSTPATGATISVTDFVRNDSATPAPASTSRLLFSTTPTLDASAIVVGTRAIPALGPGEVSSGTITFTLPAGHAGVRYLVARADSSNAVTESNEFNNASARQSITIGADLIVTLDVPGSVANSTAGATVTVTDFTRSDNSAPAGPSTTKFYLVTGTTLDTSAVLLGSRAIPALGPSTTNTGSTVLTLPASANGTFRIIAKADADNTVVEANEANNLSVASGAFTVGPDLIAWLDVPAASSTPATGATISVTDFVRNDSATPARASTSRLLFSTTPTPGASAIVVGTRAIPALGPGEVSSGTITFALPAGHAGVRHLIAQADSTNAVTESSETNNLSAAKSISIGADLIVTLDVPGGVANSVAGATVTVTDFTRSDNSAPAGPSTTKFYLVTGTTLDASAVLLGSRAIPALGASTTNTGSTTLTLPASASGTFRIIAKADADNTVVEANEANNLSVASGAFTVGADLVAWLDVPAASSTPPAGATISVTDFVRNDSATSAPASTSRLLFSTTPTLDASAIVVGTRAIPALAPGEVSSGTITFALPAGHAGVRYLVARADATSAVTESNEFNNTSTRKSITVGADLIITIDVPGSVATSTAGATVTVTDWTRSDNSAPADPSTTKFYLVRGTTLDASAVLLGSRAIPALGPSTTNTSATVLTLPASAVGTYRILAKADADDAVVEANEANNTAISSPFTLGADLVVSLDLPGSHALVAAGSTISITDFTQNRSAVAVGASRTNFYLSADAMFDAGDVPLGSRAIPALAAGAASTGATSLTLPGGIAGIYRIIAVADADGEVTEKNEANNVGVSSSFEIGPDLTVSGSTVTARAGAGATINVSDVTKNRGGAGAPASSTSIYLSANAVLDAGDRLLGSRAVPALAAGVFDSATTSVVIPPDVTAGSYFIIVGADSGGAMAESNEANNALAKPIEILPDLRVTAVTASSARAFPGTTISVGETTLNQGAAAGPSTTHFFLSTDGTIDAGDVFLGSRLVPALAAGGSNTGSIEVGIPPETPEGTYSIIAWSDAPGAIRELDEANNIRGRTVSVGPDLTVSLLVPPLSAAAGAAIAVTDTVLNRGSAAPASTMRFYLSRGTLRAPGDPEIGSRIVPALGLNATSRNSTTLTIPAGTPAGAYHVIAECDADDVVTELVETNNARARAITITQ